MESKSAAASSAHTAAGYGLHVGDRLVYDFSSQGELTLATAADPNVPDAKLTVQQTGQLRVTVYGVTPAGWTVGFSWEQVRMAMDTNGVNGDTTPADLPKSEVVVTVEKYGRISSLKVPLALSNDARNNWRDVISRWQVNLAQTDNAVKWTRVEADSTGEYLAQYASDHALPSSSLVKRKQRYLRITSATNGINPAYKVDSVAKIQFDGISRLIQGTEKITVTGLQGVGPTHSEGNYSFALVGSPTSVALGQPSKFDSSLYVAIPWAADFNPPDESTLVDDSDPVANLRDLRTAIENGQFNTPEQVTLSAKIRDEVSKDSSVADLVLDEVRADGTTNQLASALIGILSSAGTPAAQYDLLALATDDSGALSIRQMALFSYVQTDAPVPQADALLESLQQQGGDLSSSALLVLAAVGDKVRASDPARYAQISDYVLSLLNTANSTQNDFIVALDAIGNLGPAEVPAAVTQAAASDDALVRQKAIQSLERIHSDAALALINNAIWNDPSGDNQASAVQTLVTEQGAAASAELATIAATGKTDQARKEALTQLAASTAPNANAAQVIQSAATNDSSQDVRNYATQLLAKLPKG